MRPRTGGERGVRFLRWIAGGLAVLFMIATLSAILDSFSPNPVQPLLAPADASLASQTPSAAPTSRAPITSKATSATARSQPTTAAAKASTTKSAAKSTATKTTLSAKARTSTTKATVEREPSRTKTTSSDSCDLNYTGACVPIASDVDCAGGSGNGPAYVRGPVTVVGDDPYGLDRDKDGIGCE